MTYINVQKYRSTPVHLWISVLSVSYRVRPLAMQFAFINICERMGRFEKLTAITGKCFYKISNCE